MEPNNLEYTAKEVVCPTGKLKATMKVPTINLQSDTRFFEVHK